MTEIVDFFFSPFVPVQEKRLQAAAEDGLAHGSRIEPQDPQPGESVTLLFSSRADFPVERVAVYYTTDGSEPAGSLGKATHGAVVQAEPGEVLLDSRTGLRLRQWRTVIAGQPEGTLVRYRADGWNQANPQQHWYADRADPAGLGVPHGRCFAYHVDRWTTPQWWHDAIIYQIFVDRFSAASDEPPMLAYDQCKITDFFGGTLRGILEKLEYIQALGANCIWLSPVFESPTHHGYNPSDYFQVARRYGTNETLRQLIQAAHQRGMHVLLDFVANHTSDEHEAFIAALQDPTGPAAAWYTFDPASHNGYRSYAQVRNMPELHTDHPAVQQYLINAALHWLGDFGADGLRLDYVSGPSHAFWTIFQQAIKERFPAACTIGEITAPPPVIATYAGRMDGFMDFSLAGMLRSTFALRTTTLQAMLRFLDERQPELPAQMGRGTLLDNHDMHRFLWLAGGHIERLRLAATCHLTLEGTPIIYYGTEVALSQYADARKENAYARAPMLWGEQQNHHLLAHYRHLIHLRHTFPALRRGERTNVAVETLNAGTAVSQQVGAYLRHLDDEYLLIVLNNSEQSVHVRIALGEGLARAGILLQKTAMLQNLLPGSGNNHGIMEEGEIELELAAMETAVYARQ